MLGVGLDWAEDYHDVALGRPGQAVIEQFRIEHGPAGINQLVTRCLSLEPDPAEVRVVLETRHGLLVETLVDAGFTVLPVNPDLVARRRGPAKKKDDTEDARICALLALDEYTQLRRSNDPAAGVRVGRVRIDRRHIQLAPVADLAIQREAAVLEWVEHGEAPFETVTELRRSRVPAGPPPPGARPTRV